MLVKSASELPLIAPEPAYRSSYDSIEIFVGLVAQLEVKHHFHWHELTGDNKQIEKDFVR